MGILDSILGGPQKRAMATSGDVARGGFNRNVNTLNNSFDRARGDLTGGFEGAIDTLGGARGDITAGGATARGDIARGLEGAQGAFGQGRDALTSAGNRYAGLEGIGASFAPARGVLTDALGMGGEEGLARARETFGNTLQSNFERDQGLDAINRARAARGAGTISGGNIDRDTQVFGQQLANSRTNQFLDRLFGLTDREIGTTGAAAAGRSAADTNIANMFGQEAGAIGQAGVNQANIAQDTAARLSDLARGTAGLQTAQGQGLADLALNQGQGQIGLQQGLDQNTINSLLGQAQAKGQGAQNILNAGISGIGAAAALAAAPATGGTSLAGLGALGGGGGMNAADAFRLKTGTSGLF